MNVVGYVRVSTARQALEGVSREAQRERIEAWARARGGTLVEVFEDALSGKRAENRPGLQAALDLACAHQAALVVYSLSRLARSTVDAIGIAARLGAAGADLVSLSEQLDTTNAAGKLIFGVFALLAEFERNQISDRTREALGYKRSQGERIGGIPYGSHLDADGVTLRPIPAELEVLGQMVRWRVEGASAAVIAARLDALGVPTKQGRRGWHRSVVAKILRKQANVESSP